MRYFINNDCEHTKHYRLKNNEKLIYESIGAEMIVQKQSGIGFLRLSHVGHNNPNYSIEQDQYFFFLCTGHKPHSKKKKNENMYHPIHSFYIEQIHRLGLPRDIQNHSV